MKRFLIIMLALSLCFGLFACKEDVSESEAESGNDESSEAVGDTPDTVPPRIRITPKSNENVIIKQGDEYDVMDGVSGYDSVDGDITDKITVDLGGFDPSVAGEYTVKYNLKDSAGNSAEEQTKMITVTATSVLEKYEIYDGVIEGEKLDPAPHEVFGGAWYHKVVSSKDKWLGIEATVTLPEVKLSRYNGEHDESLDVDPWVKSKDNPSVYLGGNAGSESDVGLSFSLGVVDTKSNKISTGSIVFRPFWRYITDKDQDIGSYDDHGGLYTVTANGNNCYANYHWRYTEYYYLPGDTLRIIVYSPEKDKLQLQIEVVAKSTLPSSVEMREKYGWKDPENFLSPIFSSVGHGGNKNAEFKRVNAIDQSGNEGGIAAPTNTVVKGAMWHNTYLYREIDGVIYRVPMNESRRAVTDAPSADAFEIITGEESSAIGGETVTISPNNE